MVTLSVVLVSLQWGLIFKYWCSMVELHNLFALVNAPAAAAGRAVIGSLETCYPRKEAKKTIASRNTRATEYSGRGFSYTCLGPSTECYCSLNVFFISHPNSCCRSFHFLFFSSLFPFFVFFWFVLFYAYFLLYYPSKLPQ
jgi:hypothetical protein